MGLSICVEDYKLQQLDAKISIWRKVVLILKIGPPILILIRMRPRGIKSVCGNVWRGSYRFRKDLPSEDSNLGSRGKPARLNSCTYGTSRFSTGADSTSRGVVTSAVDKRDCSTVRDKLRNRRVKETYTSQ
jgi:hypothetical protein